MSVKRPDPFVATMIRALFVLSLIVAVASAFVAPVNHAAGESMIHRPFFHLKIGESKQVQSWGFEKVVGLQGTIRRGGVGIPMALDSVCCWLPLRDRSMFCCMYRSMCKM
jgi:hypothetical protein